jgi:S1-C subfamily serine protease
MDPIAAIPALRESVVAVFRYRALPQKSTSKHKKKGTPQTARFNVGWGSGFCIVPDRYIVTAFHVINDGQPRNPADRFVAFTVPGNGDQAYHFPVTAFPVERPDVDLAVLEIGPSAAAGLHLPAIPVSFANHQDGSRVVTVGFPAPEIAGLNVDAQGNYMGGQFFLKSHANEGILSAQYMLGQVHVYEFNVGWHHGESGGPVLRLQDPVAVFTIMQQYRNIKSPHGVVAGPHRGCALEAIRQEIERLGCRVV